VYIPVTYHIYPNIWQEFFLPSSSCEKWWGGPYTSIHALVTDIQGLAEIPDDFAKQLLVEPLA